MRKPIHNQRFHSNTRHVLPKPVCREERLSISTKKPAKIASQDQSWEMCPTCGTKTGGWLLDDTDTQEALALAAIVVVCTPIVMTIVAGLVLVVLLCAAIVLFVGLNLLAVFAVFLAAALAAAAQDG